MGPPCVNRRPPAGAIRREHRPRRVPPRDPADPAAAARAGAADPDVRALGLDTPTTDLVLGLGERPRQVAVEDVASGHAELGLELDRGAGLEAGLAVGRAQQAVLDRLGEDGVERAQRAFNRRVLGCVVFLAEQPRRHVQPEHGQRLDAGGAQLRREDARVGERMAVGLARR